MYDELINLAKKTEINIETDVHPWLMKNFKCRDLWDGLLYSPGKMRSRLSDSNGIRSDDVFEFFIFRKTGRKKLLFSVYYPESDIAGLHRMEINIRRSSGMNKEKPEPALIDTLWINSRKEIVYQNGDSLIPVLKKTDLPKDFLGGKIPEYEYDKDKSIKNMIMQLYKQEDHLFYMDTRRGYSNVTTPWILREFLFSKETTKRNTKKQKLIDDIGLELGNPHIDADYIKNVIVPSYRLGMLMEIYVLEKIHDGCVMRCFVKRLGDDFPIMERRRIFVTKKDVIYARRNNLGEFVVTTKKTERQIWFSHTVPFNFDIIDGTPLEHIKSYLSPFEVGVIGSLFYAALLSPIVEYVLKAGMQDYVAISLYGQYNSGHMVIKNLLDCMGVVFYSEKFKDLVGMTKKQYSEVLKRYPISGYWRLNGAPLSPVTPMSYIKVIASVICGKKDTRSLDDRTFDGLLCIFDVISKTAKDCSISLGGLQNIVVETREIIDRLYRIHGIKMDRIAEIFYDMGMSDRTFYLINTYADYLCMYDSLRDAMVCRQFPLVPDMNELVAAHDRLVCAFNREKQEIDTVNFLKNCTNCKKYEYEDDDYMVLGPTDPAQVKNEGDALHHCVSSYIPRVASGDTNIMFIRKKDEPGKPFFTAQVNNDGQVVQIHGLQNRNVNTEPGLEVFVKKWIEERNLTFVCYDEII